jgi:membrane protease YdiL (CAAX protease family)
MHTFLMTTLTKILKKPYFKTILFLLINCTLFVLFSYLLNKGFNYISPQKELAQDWLTKESFFIQLFLVGILAPIFETLIFQTAIIEIVYIIRKIKKYRIFIACFASTTLFGLEHTFSVAYFILGLIIGLYLSIFYIYSKKKGINPTLSVLLVHASWNIFALFYNH